MEYLKIVKTFDGDEYAEMASDVNILDHMDMLDCSYDEIEVYRLAFGKAPEKLELHGAWHNFSDPLYMKATDSDGNIVFDGYGTDH